MQSKISFIRFYPKFSGKVLTLGPAIALLTFGMFATAGAYYFMVTLL